MEKINSYISRLSSSDVSVQESSLRHLINLTYSSIITPEDIKTEPKLLLIIYNEVKIETFKSLLNSENEVIKMLAIWLLSHLCGSIYISSEVLKSQLILDEVLKLLEIENEDISEKILWFLENLTMNPNHSFLLGEGVIISLIQFLKFSNSKLLKLASKPLIHLLHKETCGDYLNNQQLFCQNQGVELITDLLNSSGVGVLDLELVGPIVSIIHVLSIYIPKIRILLANSTLLRQLISIFSLNCSPDIKDTTMMILVNLSLTEEAEIPIFESGAIMPLLDIIASISSSEILRYHAISCLANLTSNPRIRTVLRSRYLIDSLCEILKEIDGYGDEYSLMMGSITVLISNLCIDEICRYRALQTDIQSMLINISNYPHTQVRESIQRTLENLKEPIPEDILNDLNNTIVEDESDGFEDTPLVLDNFMGSISNGGSLSGSVSSHSSRHSTLGFSHNGHYNGSSSSNLLSSSTSPPVKKGIYRLSTFTSPSRVSSNNLLNGASLSTMLNSNNIINSGIPENTISNNNITNSNINPVQQQQSNSKILINSPPKSQSPMNSYIQISSPQPNGTIPPKHTVDDPGLAFRRGKIIKEIMDTEQSYVHALGVCIRVYFNPLVVAPTNPPILPRTTVEAIFSNIDKIFRINCEFLKKLRLVILNTNQSLGSFGNLNTAVATGANYSIYNNTPSTPMVPDVMEVGQAFLWFWEQQFSVQEYRHYINSFNKAMESVQDNRSKLPKFKEFLDKCQFSEQCKSETIDSYLIRPIQRLPRYILLLTDLLAHTVDMLERNSIEDALFRTKQIVDQLNESKRKAENFTKTLILQQKFTNISDYENKNHSPNSLIPKGGNTGNGVVYTKTIIKEGLIMQSIKSKPSQYRYLILFNDQLYIAIQKKDKYQILQIIPLLDLKIIYLTNSNSNNNENNQNINNTNTNNSNSNSSILPDNAFQLLWSNSNDSCEKEMLLYTTDPDEREKWVKQIREACNVVKKSHIENILKSNFQNTNPNRMSTTIPLKVEQ